MSIEFTQDHLNRMRELWTSPTPSSHSEWDTGEWAFSDLNEPPKNTNYVLNTDVVSWNEGQGSSNMSGIAEQLDFTLYLSPERYAELEQELPLGRTVTASWYSPPPGALRYAYHEYEFEVRSMRMGYDEGIIQSANQTISIAMPADGVPLSSNYLQMSFNEYRRQGIL